MIKNLPIRDLDPVLVPMKHQSDTFMRSREMHYYALWWEMGTGKSLTLIHTIEHLFLIGEIDGVIIVSDKGAYLNWPITELPKSMMLGLPHRISTYSSARVPDPLIGQDDCLDILVMNVEAFSGSKALDHAEQFIKSHYILLAVDEATSIKNIKSARTKNLITLARKCDYRRILTGTPITQSPLDLFAQCEFLQPGLLGHRTFVGFRSEYAVMRQMNLGSRQFQVVDGYRNLDKLTKKIEHFSSRILKKDCLDLPEKVYEIIYVEHTPEQRKVYDDLKTYAMSQFDQGLLTSTSAITTINKLHQINCGHVKLDDRTTVDIPNNRIQVLLDLLEKIEGKVLIWCAFQRDVELIIAALEALPEGYPVHYYGNTTCSEREDALKNFEADPSCKWFVGTAATGGKGLSLTQATTTVYYSNSDSAEDRWQSEDRNHRKGQMNQVTYFDLVTPGTVDVKILQRLKAKENIAYCVLDKFRDLMGS